jgi:hypothetical protein
MFYWLAGHDAYLEEKRELTGENVFPLSSLLPLRHFVTSRKVAGSSPVEVDFIQLT